MHAIGHSICLFHRLTCRRDMARACDQVGNVLAIVLMLLILLALQCESRVLFQLDAAEAKPSGVAKEDFSLEPTFEHPPISFPKIPPFPGFPPFPDLPFPFPQGSYSPPDPLFKSPPPRSYYDKFPPPFYYYKSPPPPAYYYKSPPPPPPIY